MDWKEVVRRLRARVRLYMGSCAQGKRSDVIYRIARTLAERGADANEIACVVAASRAYQSKYADNARHGRRDIERLCMKMRKLSS